MLVTDLAERAHSSADQPDSAVMSAGRRHLTDTVGALLAGRRTLGARVSALADSLGLVAAEGTAPGLQARRVGYLGGAFAHCWELDDIDRVSIVCPGCVVLPAMLATVQLRPELTWAQLIGCYVAGYEVALAAAAAADTSELIATGWWPTSLFAPLGAAAAVSVALGHGVARTADAIALAAQQAGGLLVGTNDGRYLNPGLAAERAVCAALMADAGWAGPTDVLDHERSPLKRRRGAGSGRPLLESVSLKAHAAAKHLQAAIDAVVSLRARLDRPVDELVEIRCELPTALARIVDRPAPFTTATGALASAQYTLALALVTGTCYPDQFSAGELADPRVGAVAQRVHVTGSADLSTQHPERWGARVEIVTGSGTVADRRLSAEGDPERPFSDAQVLAKFVAITSAVVGATAAGELGRTLLKGADDVALNALRSQVLAPLSACRPEECR